MTPGEALVSLFRRGVSVSVEGDRLFVDPGSALTDDERAALRAEKRTLVAFLRLLQASTPEDADEQTGADLLAEAERFGASLYLRQSQGDVGIRNGGRIPDALLLRLARMQDRLMHMTRSAAPKPKVIDDDMTLLDYASEVLGHHEEWPGARPSAHPAKLHSYYTFGDAAHRYEYDETVTLPTPTPIDELRATPAPAKVKSWAKKAEPNLNTCGGCSARFAGPTAQASADTLRQHIEADPCSHYMPSEVAKLCIAS